MSGIATQIISSFACGSNFLIRVCNLLKIKSFFTNSDSDPADADKTLKRSSGSRRVAAGAGSESGLQVTNTINNTQFYLHISGLNVIDVSLYLQQTSPSHRAQYIRTLTDRLSYNFWVEGGNKKTNPVEPGPVPVHSWLPIPLTVNLFLKCEYAVKLVQEIFYLTGISGLSIQWTLLASIHSLGRNVQFV